MERKINKPKKRQRYLTRFGQYSCLCPGRVSLSLMREYTSTRIYRSSLYPTRALVSERIPLVHPSLNLEYYFTPRVIHTLVYMHNLEQHTQRVRKSRRDTTRNMGNSHLLNSVPIASISHC